MVISVTIDNQRIIVFSSNFVSDGVLFFVIWIMKIVERKASNIF
jgi:hypothetical protein